MNSTEPEERTTSAPISSVSVKEINTSDSQLLSDALLQEILLYFNNFVMAISIFGIFSNSVNIVVFYKMGFSVVTNISLVCLANVDMFCLFIIIIGSCAGHPAIRDDYLVISMYDLAITLTRVHYFFSAMGAWITAVISVERSCCVAFPMKVKRIFTPRNTIGLIVGMVIYQIATGLPQSIGIGWTVTTSPLTNKTLIIFDMRKYKPRMTVISRLVSYSFPTTTCFIIVLVATIFLIVSFNKSRQLRNSMTGSKTEKISAKDAILVRSVIFICIIFIVGIFPSVLIYIVSTIYPSFFIHDPQLGNIVSLIFQVSYLFQGTSCSVNIFVYLWLSSRFKQIFKETFLCFMKS